MPNEEVKPWKIIDYIDRFEVLDILDRMADWYAEPPVDLKELELVHEIKFKIKQLQSIDAKEVKHGEWGVNVGMNFNKERICPICKKRIESNYWEFCSHCGAKIDGGKAE